MDKSTIDKAIKNHGAAAVYAAAADRLAGNRAKWQAVGLPDSKHLGEVNEVMTDAFALMSDTERSSDLQATNAALTKLAAKKTVTIRVSQATAAQIVDLAKFGGTSDVIAVAVDRLWQNEGRKEMKTIAITELAKLAEYVSVEDASPRGVTTKKVCDVVAGDMVVINNSLVLVVA